MVKQGTREGRLRVQIRFFVDSWTAFAPWKLKESHVTQSVEVGIPFYPNNPNFTKLASFSSSARYNWRNLRRL